MLDELTFTSDLLIIIATVPDTPLNDADHVGSFFWRITMDSNKKEEEHELKKVQTPLTIPQQIENLRELGLTIEDEERAAAFLNDVSYFRFIKAYSLGLKPKNGNYQKGVSFEHLVQLYLFNANFRQLLFAQIEKIEINLHCRVSNQFSLAHGSMGYLDADNFETYPPEFSQEIQREIGRNWRTPFIRNFQTNYENGDIPFYAVVEILSFGTLSKFLKNMKASDKKAVAMSYGVQYTYLQSWIESIAYVRNICAHYGRLYNTKLTKTPSLYREDRKNGITNGRVMGTLVCMKRLLPQDRHWNEFVDTIELLFEKYPAVKKQTMGFPESWKEILLSSK